MTKNEILQLINDGITTKTAPFSITQVDLGNIMTDMVNLSATTFMSGTNISVNGRGLETDPFVLEMTADTNTYLTEGTDISITGDGSISSPYNINFTGITSPWDVGSATDSIIANNGTTNATANYSTASGYNTLASNTAAHAEGSNTTASGPQSHAEGVSTIASSVGSHAEGSLTTASGAQSHSEGNNTTASGTHAHAEGCDSIASGGQSHAGGVGNTAPSYGERAIGTYGTNYTPNSTTLFESKDRIFNIGIGTGTTSRNDAFQVIKDGTVLAPSLTTALIDSVTSDKVLITKEYFNANSGSGGGDTLWTGGTTGTTDDGHGGTIVIGLNSITSVPNKNIGGDAIGDYAVAFGYNTTATGFTSTAIGFGTQANGLYSTASGYYTTASGSHSTSSGGYTTASGSYSTASGYGTTSSGNYSHAEGDSTEASGDSSHAEGFRTTASGQGAHSEGGRGEASGDYSHSEGISTTASGYASHAEGDGTVASGRISHAEGQNTIASGELSHAGGRNNTAPSYSETVIGLFGTNYTPNATTSYDASDRVFNIGNGTNDFVRSDAFQVIKDGTVLAPSLTTGLISSASNKVLITKEYADANYAGGGGDTLWTGGTSGTDSITTVTNRNNGGDAISNRSIAFGYATTASGDYSTASGYYNTASGYASNASNAYTTASGDYSHAEGTNTLSSGFYSHAEGNTSTASNYSAHAEGGFNTASGAYSHAGGRGNEAFSYGERAIGTFGTTYTPSGVTTINIADRAFNIGNGTSGGARGDAFTIMKNGSVGINIDNFETNNNGNTLEVNGNVYSDQYRLSALNTAPSSDTDTGTTGEIRITSGFIYVCVGTNSWVRAALSGGF